MKKWMTAIVFAGLTLMLCADQGNAQAANSVEVLRSSHTCQPVTVSTMGAGAGVTDIVSNPTQVWAFVEIQNLEVSAGLWCSENSTVSTTTTAGIPGAGVRGQKVPATETKKWLLPPTSRWYCVCDATGGTKTCDTEVCKGK